jgi:capsule polysaccharide export protein KpsE/RkpR
LSSEKIECDAQKFEGIPQDLKELKEYSKVQQEKIESLENNLTLLVQELAELKTKMEENNENLKLELGKIFKKELDEFGIKFIGEA